MDLPHEDRRDRWYHVSQNKFLAASLAAVVLGFAAGHVIKLIFPSLSDDDMFYIGFPGEVLMRMFQLVSVPLILTSVITGVSKRIDAPKKAVRNAVLYFGLTTLLSTSLGITLVLIFTPGYTSDESDDLSDVNGIMDLMRNLVPDNLIQACFQRFKTERVELDSHGFEAKAGVAAANDSDYELVPHYIERTNTLGLIVCSFVAGLMLKDMGERGRAITDILLILNRTTKYVTNLILCYHPVGVLFLVTRHVIEVDDLDIFYPVGVFVAVVVMGHLIHGLMFLPVVYTVIAKHNPFLVLKGASPALKTALVTGSGPATMVSVIQCLEERLGISHRVVRFELPLATALNADGTALYELIAAVFVAELNHIHLDLSQIVTLGVTSGIATIKGVGIPSTGGVTTLFVLSAVGLPGMEAGILVLIKWLLDVSNTVVNVWGNCIALALLNQLSKGEIQEWEEHDALRARNLEEALDGLVLHESSGSFHSD